MLQMDLQWQHPIGNFNAAEQLIAEMDEPTDLIILPEMFNTGFTLDAADNSETMEGPTVEWLQKLADRQQTAVCGSLIVNDNGKYFNRMVWVLQDGTMGYYDKRHLFRRQRTPCVYSWRMENLSTDCYDLRFPAWSRGFDEFDLMIYVANWPATRQSSWDILLPARAVENQCYVAGINRIGVDGNNIIYTGGSMVLDFLGRTVKCSGIAESAVTATLKGSNAKRYREKFPAWKDGDKFTFDPVQ